MNIKSSRANNRHLFNITQHSPWFQAYVTQ